MSSFNSNADINIDIVLIDKCKNLKYINNCKKRLIALFLFMASVHHGGEETSHFLLPPDVTGNRDALLSCDRNDVS